MRRRLLAIVAVAAIAVPAIAVAASRIADRDDSAGAVDLSGARAAHNRVSDELVWVVDTHDDLHADLLFNGDGPPGSVCVNAWTRGRPGERGPDYDVCATSDARGRELRGTVARHGGTGRVRRVGRAGVEQATPTRLVLRVDPDLLRRPRSVRWTVQAVAFSPGCPSATGCEDYVPDRPRTSRTTLRTPR